MARTLEWNSDKVIILGRPNTGDLQYLGAAYHKICDQKCYKQIKLDFSKIDNVFESFMVPVVAIARHYRKTRDVDTIIVPPEDKRLASLFHNCNWSHLCSPERYSETTFEGSKHLPAMIFDADRDPKFAEDRILDMILSSVEGLDRKTLSAVKWALGEILDNVITHSESQAGGVVQASTLSKSKTVEFVIADCGIGIASAMKISDHAKAIEQAIQEGVTSKKETNQGNGLFGTYRIGIQDGCQIQVHSHYGYLIADSKQTRIDRNRSPYPGTVVVCRIDCSQADLVRKALVINGRVHDPAFDFIEDKFELDSENELRLKIKTEVPSLSFRRDAEPVRTKISNLLASNPSAVLIIDFEDVFVIGSSFADEVFGKLFMQIGPMNFMRRIKFVKIDRTVQGLIDRAILLRSRAPETN